MKDHEIAAMVNDITRDVRRLVDDAPQCLRAIISETAIRHFYMANEYERQGHVDRLTDTKTKQVISNHNHQITGHVLVSEHGNKCIVDAGAVRWLTKDDFWSLMHKQEGA